ncbi:MAG: STAS domain-containing protein [Candidatus Eisenbacteria bacterium]|nr:STAS domain-containing protein [Candidatus Eisenbacteria bacterium]
MSVWKIEVEKIEHASPHATVFRISGVLTDTREAFALLDEIRGALHHKVPLVILNLAGIERMTSAGVGIIAAAFTAAQRDGGKLCLVEATERSRQLLELVGLWALVPHCATEAEALS